MVGGLIFTHFTMKNSQILLTATVFYGTITILEKCCQRAVYWANVKVW